MDSQRCIAAANRVNTAARLVYNAVSVAMLLYGSETWVLQKKKRLMKGHVKSIRTPECTYGEVDDSGRDERGMQKP